jgi:hypothetical protein
LICVFTGEKINGIITSSTMKTEVAVFGETSIYIWEFDFVCSSWLATEVSEHLICPIFIGQAVEEEFFLDCLIHPVLHKISEEDRYQSHCGGIMRPSI